MKPLFENKTTVCPAWNITKLTSSAGFPAGTQWRWIGCTYCFREVKSMYFRLYTTWPCSTEGTKAQELQGDKRLNLGVVTCFSWRPDLTTAPSWAGGSFGLMTWNLAQGGWGQLASVAIFRGQWKIISSWRWASRDAAWPKVEEGEPCRRTRRKCQSQTAASGCCTLDLFTPYLIKLHYKGIQCPEWSMSQTTGINSVMCSAEISREVNIIWKPPFWNILCIRHS